MKNEWRYAYGIREGTLQLVGWDEALSVRSALKRLRREAGFYEWRSRTQTLQNQRIHFIEHRLKGGWC